ncbi:hypothetical protein QFC19_002774 [Naganishia cerealis]|uniref:Uncharacterized protein n=1 Tax=Naganishia cerealis TaxID=610337 RepID=A0ACC2W8Y1_9TREE|nr:hypothetical protein QFC19_002774 [Naganishia cerealis]
MHTIFITAYAHNPRLNFEVFLHKADSVHNDWLGGELLFIGVGDIMSALHYATLHARTHPPRPSLAELYREINQRYTDEIWDYDLKDFFPSHGDTSRAGSSQPTATSRPTAAAATSPLQSANANVYIEDEDAFLESLMNAARFFMTSVHDSSLQEAWGRVMQSLMGSLYGPIEGLMSTFARVRPPSPAVVHSPNRALLTPPPRVDEQHGESVSVRYQCKVQRRRRRLDHRDEKLSPLD